MAVRKVAVVAVALLALVAPRRADAGAAPASNVLIAGMLGGNHAYGCGVIVAASDATVTVLTAAHNGEIERPVYYTVTGETLVVTSTTAIDGYDEMLVTARRPRTPFTVAAPAERVESGMRVTIWGPIAHVPFTEHAGATRALDARVTDAPHDAVAIDCAQCEHGDSGAGVYDERGRLIGIVTRGYYDGARKVLVLVEPPFSGRSSRSRRRSSRRRFLSRASS